MSSSGINSYHGIEDIIAREHLDNFHQLPFSLYFTSPYSPLPPELTFLNIRAFFRQVPTSSIPIPRPVRNQRLILVPTEYHYRYIIDRRQPRITSNSTNPAPSNSSNSSSTSSNSSLPPLIPISPESSAPPAYTDSPSTLPAYQEIESCEDLLDVWL